MLLSRAMNAGVRVLTCECEHSHVLDTHCVPINEDAGVHHVCAGEQNSDGLTHWCIHGRILRAQVIQARPRAGRVGRGGERGTQRIEKLRESARE